MTVTGEPWTRDGTWGDGELATAHELEREFTVTEMVDWKAWLSRLPTSSRGRVGDSLLVLSAAMSATDPWAGAGA